MKGPFNNYLQKIKMKKIHFFELPEMWCCFRRSRSRRHPAARTWDR